jgi:HTH-type transcriptional repressor of puuD
MSDDGLAPGKRLSEIRQQLGLSQRRAAELSGLTHSAISTIEQDKVSPAISTLQKLLKVYGLSLSSSSRNRKSLTNRRWLSIRMI